LRNKKIRILIAKPGLDGHDRGVKVIAQLLRDAGMEVIYTGLHQTIDQIVETAVQEDVNVIGLSILSGSHFPITEKLMKKIEETAMNDVLIIVGGNIPQRDIDDLKKLGVKGVFPTGSKFGDIINFIKINTG
jgi:methylmalonyl-CoA mutase C-terminal domain/subunit